MIVMICGQWYRVPAAMLQDETLTRSEIAVFAVIADKADGTCAELSKAELQRLAGCSRATVTRALKRLQERGYIAIEEQAGGANVYRQCVLEGKRRSRSRSGSRARSEGASATIEEYKAFINVFPKEVNGNG